jgi:hypothetical protein
MPVATREAVERRKINRRLATKFKRQNSRAQVSKITVPSPEVPARRLRAIPEHRRQPIHYDPRYWQARKCEWDACAEELRPRRCAPDESPFWGWWANALHPKQRQELERLSAACRDRVATEGDELTDDVDKLLKLNPDDQGQFMGRMTEYVQSQGGLN